jgi:hypothetical protein
MGWSSMEELLPSIIRADPNTAKKKKREREKENSEKKKNDQRSSFKLII